MINFKESTNKNYQVRTEENVRLADVTISFSADFNTPGERSTKSACVKYNVPFIEFKVTSYTESSLNLLEEINKLDKPNGIIINVAGNGLFTLVKHKYSQNKIDTIVLNAIKDLVDNGIEIREIRSGGQTGADESGLKAALTLGIEATCLAPKGWRFRGEDNRDVYDEKRFKERFNYEIYNKGEKLLST